MNKVTYHIPTTEQGREELKALVKRLFPATEPEITRRVIGTLNINWQDLGSLADLLQAKPEYGAVIAFTIDEPESYTDEQTAILNRPGVTVKRDIEPEDFIQSLAGL